jgi:hypothetical protein
VLNNISIITITTHNKSFFVLSFVLFVYFSDLNFDFIVVNHIFSFRVVYLRLENTTLIHLNCFHHCKSNIFNITIIFENDKKYYYDVNFLFKHDLLLMFTQECLFFYDFFFYDYYCFNKHSSSIMTNYFIFLIILWLNIILHSKTFDKYHVLIN